MNRHYKKLCALLAVLTDGEEGVSDMIHKALAANNIRVSKSRVHGWGVAPGSRNYREMTADELLDLLDSIKKYLEFR